MSVLEAGGCVLHSLQTSALLVDCDQSHWDAAGTASVKTTFSFLLLNKDTF